MRPWSIKKQGIRQIVGLSIQFLLGTYVSMFVNFPENGTEAANWNFAKTSWVFMFHMLIGWLLFANATVILVRAFRKNDRVWKIAGGLGWLSITASVVAGEVFTGNQQDNFSLIMATGFIAAMLSYVWGIYKSR